MLDFISLIPIYDLFNTFINLYPYPTGMLASRLYCTVCPGSSDPNYIVSYYIKWVTTSWTYGTLRKFQVRDIAILKSLVVKLTPPPLVALGSMGGGANVDGGIYVNVKSVQLTFSIVKRNKVSTGSPKLT